MPKVITYKKLKNETETVMSYGDVIRIIEENLGSEILDALWEFQKEDDEENDNTPSARVTKYIEDGIWEEQLRESGVIEKIVESILIDLEDQGYLKKSKDIKKFIPDEETLIEHLDECLSPGIMKYFDY